MGNLGRALLTYNFSIHDEMTITEAFDVNQDVIGEQVGRVVVKDSKTLKHTLSNQDIDVVILTTPEQVAQSVTDELVESGIKGIMNFTPARVSTPNDVQVHHIDLGIELQSLLFFMRNYDESMK